MYDVLVVALLDPRHPGPVAVAVAVAVADTFRMGGDHESYKSL